MFTKDIFRKKKEKSNESISRRGKIVSEIVDLALERKDLQSNLENLRNEVLIDIKKELDGILREIEVLKKAIDVTDRKINDNAMILEDELNVEESGLYQ